MILIVDSVPENMKDSVTLFFLETPHFLENVIAPYVVAKIGEFTSAFAQGDKAGENLIKNHLLQQIPF